MRHSVMENSSSVGVPQRLDEADGSPLVVWLYPRAMTELDEWRRGQHDACSRAEAVRRLLELTFGESKQSAGEGSACTAGAEFAQQAAFDQIEELQRNSGQSQATRARNQRRLTKMPAELSRAATKK
jgi:hypothetical protein